MDKMLEDALKIADEFRQQNGGMTSVGVRWNPYQCQWVADASWSSGDRIAGDFSDSPTDAVCMLIDRLRDEKTHAAVATSHE